ncbi:MAG: hydrogenase maturation nickel metallochaperone HypA [Terrisporobacter othiniensis]|uniref:Hydrogenase maturation factor HypA n=1 Tax=Terrisporobacter petrolearius TaxID=1460447 RepID=A0ABZ3FF98_9FIRM|nr:hydrogenase maturation nickel metallochaperone HypA [Terrisporobacter petrolearius]MDU4861679.1 hydrogenase maturation nickel metallochaperone HypA [Terrisporobacter othiniensis]MDU6995332.1 hydrogenase maturation nickel metallochaperone HypA [Terrisporobacter othiniensis]UPA32268.1 hydrogenase maturation nickel metallochaperone HypA [Terrisporobacter glycolicus]SFJ20772.1 Hydrogenase-3 nickel incorporation protein HypA [Terrisporobacter glycolicus]
MHETSIIYGALEIAKESGENNNLKRIHKIYMKIGEFTCVDENSMRFVFEALKKNTICEDADLIIDKVKAKARCDYCNEEFEINFTNKICPKCHKHSNNICKGYELLVWQIEGD